MTGTKLFFFPKRIQIFLILQIKTLVNKLPLFLSALLLQLTPDNAQSPPPPSPTLQLLLRSIKKVYPTVLLQTAYLTTSTFNKLNIEPCQLKKEQYIHCIYSHFLYNGYKYIKCNMVNLFPLWHTNIYKPLSSSLPALECQQQNLCDPVLNLKTNKF